MAADQTATFRPASRVPITISTTLTIKVSDALGAFGESHPARQLTPPTVPGEAYFNPAANGFVYPNAPTPPDAPAAPIDVRVDTADDEVYVDENGIFQVRIAGDRTEAPPPTSTTVRFPGGRLQYTDSYALYDGQPVFTD